MLQPHMHLGESSPGTGEATCTNDRVAADAGDLRFDAVVQHEDLRVSTGDHFRVRGADGSR